MKEIMKRGKKEYYLNDLGKKVYITNNKGNKLYFTDDFVDISYDSNNSIAKSLSNMFPYQFSFMGYPVNSVQGLLQSLKYKDLEIQRYLFSYYGEYVHHIRVASFNEDGCLYFMGKPINRFDIDYQELLNDLYLSLNRNPLFTNILKYTDKRVLLDSSGDKDPYKTILTPREYIDRLTIIRDSLSKKEARKKLEVLSQEIIDEYRLDNHVKGIQLTKK